MGNDVSYGYTRSFPGADYAAIVEKTTEALKTEGFGVLTRIDVHDTLKQKLGVDFRRMVILGACNPPLAHRALTAEVGVGLLLPCNVTVFEDGNQVVVQMVKPEAMFAVVKNPALQPVVDEVDAKLRRALEKV